MNLTNEISGTNKMGEMVTVKRGDKVTAVALDGVVFEDVVRVCFVQTDTLGNSYPAVILTTRSWSALKDLV